jgi:hypothetical protein
MQAKPTLIVLLVGLFSASFISKAQQSANPLDARSTITGQPTLPSQPGNALVYIYRSGSVVGAANHPRLFVNEVFVGDLHVSNYISREVPSGTVLFSFLPKSTVNLTLYQALANNLTKKKKDVLQADVEACGCDDRGQGDNDTSPRQSVMVAWRKHPSPQFDPDI